MDQVPYVSRVSLDGAVEHARFSAHAYLDIARAYNAALAAGADRVGTYVRFSRPDAMRALAAAAVWRGILAEYKARAAEARHAQ